MRAPGGVMLKASGAIQYARDETKYAVMQSSLCAAIALCQAHHPQLGRSGLRVEQSAAVLITGATSGFGAAATPVPAEPSCGALSSSLLSGAICVRHLIQIRGPLMEKSEAVLPCLARGRSRP